MLNKYIYAAPVDDFNSASGFTAGKLDLFFNTLAVALITVVAIWIMVAAIRNWMKAESDALETFMTLIRAVLVVVALGIMLTLI